MIPRGQIGLDCRPSRAPSGLPLLARFFALPGRSLLSAQPCRPVPFRPQVGLEAAPDTVSTENSCEQVPHIIYIARPTLAPLHPGNPSPRNAFCKGRCIPAETCPTLPVHVGYFGSALFFLPCKGIGGANAARRAFWDTQFDTSVSAALAHTFYTEFRHSTDRDYG